MKFETCFFLETTWPVLTKEMKICECDAGHMTKMAATPFMVKTHQKSSSELMDQFPLNLVFSI